jgi:hypothetical protein
MKRCPKCGRFGIEYDPSLKLEICLWKDCNWVNIEKKEINDEEFFKGRTLNYTNFIKKLKPKKEIVV